MIVLPYRFFSRAGFFSQPASRPQPSALPRGFALALPAQDTRGWRFICRRRVGLAAKQLNDLLGGGDRHDDMVVLHQRVDVQRREMPHVDAVDVAPRGSPSRRAPA